MAWRPVVWLIAVAVWAASAASGCSRNLTSGDGGVLADPAACGCKIDETGTLTMSWDCYCRDASHCQPFRCPAASSYVACGLTVLWQDTSAGVNSWVYDNSGAMVGIDYHWDIGRDVCPTDPSLWSSHVRAGKLPDPTCDKASCRCSTDGSGTCQATGGGGTSDGCDCRVENGVLTMTWECFCSTFGGCIEPLRCDALSERTDYPACGLVEVTRLGFGIVSSVYDAGTLVGRTLASDTSYYSCPNNAPVAAPLVRAGRAPAADCAPVVCSACTTSVSACQ